MDVAILLHAGGAASLPLLVGDLVQGFADMCGWHLHVQPDANSPVCADLIHLFGEVAPDALPSATPVVSTFGSSNDGQPVASERIRRALLHVAPDCVAPQPWRPRSLVTFLGGCEVEPVVGAVMRELPSRLTPKVLSPSTPRDALMETLATSAAAIILDETVAAHYWAACALAAGAPLITPRTPWFQDLHYETRAIRLVRPDDMDHLAACARGLIANEAGASEKITRGLEWAHHHQWHQAVPLLVAGYRAASDERTPAP